MDPTDEGHLRRAIELATAAREGGDEPFGSLLVGPDGLLAEEHNTTRTDGDITAHPELKLARWAARELESAVARATTMYTSCEPCPMCAAAIERSGLGRVVFALSSEQAEAVAPEAHRRRPVVAEGPALYAAARVPLAPAALEGDRVRLRPAAPADVPALEGVLADPEVARIWGPEAAGELLDDDEIQVFVVLAGGEVAGFVQFSEITDPMYRSANIDIALASPWHGRGIGTDAVRTMARHLIEDRGHHRLTIDPAAANARAIATYGRVGFKPVGVMRAYERGPDGSPHDGLLMDLLAGELS